MGVEHGKKGLLMGGGVQGRITFYALGPSCEWSQTLPDVSG